MAATTIDVGHLSTWTIRGFALISIGLLVAVRYRLVSPTARKASGLTPLLGAGGLFLLMLFAWDRVMLWYSAIFFTALALAALTMGRMPADMPSARDPACQLHPEYARVARRGKIAVGLAAAEITVAVILSIRYVDGL